MAFNINNYQEKYRWSGYDNRNRPVQLRIYQRSDTAFTLTAVRGLVDIKLQMQGSSEPAYAPIVKTSLTFTLVDAPDLATAGEKSGDWQEFYTPDSTLYLVVLYRNGQLTWRGYITPDSWSESLSYRGNITITARDNLGHLQDLPFDAAGDANGLIRVRDVITGALDAIDFPMQLDSGYDAADRQTLRDTHGLLLDGYVSVSELKDGSWLDALEGVLVSTGYTLRYAGVATEKLAPIRNISLGSYTSRASALGTAVTVEFYGGDRELDPAVRQITERVDFGAEMESDETNQASWKYGAVTANTYSGAFTFLGSVPRSFTGRSWKNGNTDFAAKGGWSDTFGYLNPQRCEISAVLRQMDGVRALDMGVGLAAAQGTAGTVRPAWKMRANTTDVTLRLEFARAVQLDNGSFPFTISPFLGYIEKIQALVSYTAPDGTVWYWQNYGGTGAWGTGPAAPHTYDVVTETPEVMPDTFALDIQLADISDKAAGGGWLQIEFYNITHVGITAGDIYGLFDRCTAIKATLNAKRVLKSDTITTVNNSAYNVRLERKPAFGAMSATVPWLSPKNYTRALWAYNDGAPAPMDYTFYLNGYAATTALPLPAQIHKQMLCYCYTPLEVLGGNCGPVDKAQLLGFGLLVSYKGKDYIIQGGTLEVLQNRIGGAVLHEFAWYADMWDETHNPSYSGSPSYVTDSTLNGANGNSAIADRSGGGGGGGGTGTVTSVGLAVPAGLQVTGSPVTTSGIIQLSLAAGYEIPLTTDINKGVAAYGWGNHANAGYIKDAAGIVAALGYTPANGSAESLQRPRIRIVSGYGNPRTPALITPILEVRHPLLETNIGAVAVLMLWRKRRTKALGEDVQGYKNYPRHRSAWGEARGASAAAAALTSSGTFTLDALREHILHNYMCVYGQALPSVMTLAQFYALTVANPPRFGRLVSYPGTIAAYEAATRGRELFGVAIRIPNPAFAAKVDGTLAETTRQIDGVPRYYYTDIAPLVVQVTDSAESEKKYEIGFDASGRLA